jgi:antitoxin (DNA-binding transcriptional repressor) of toxin-antitoxin stability system
MTAVVKSANAPTSFADLRYNMVFPPRPLPNTIYTEHNLRPKGLPESSVVRLLRLAFAPPQWTLNLSEVDLWLSDSYISGMATYSVAEAKNNLSELIDRTLRGEGVLITRHGKPVIEFKPVPAQIGPVSDAELNWLASNRLQPNRSPAEDAGALITRIRDEDAH